MTSDRTYPAPRSSARTGEEQIALWEGTPLEESHRHHSHLAGITPFDVLDPADEAWHGIYERSLRTWIRQGMGMWSGWCVPWAAMLHSRFDNGEMAELLLEIWDRVYTNEGHGTLHDCVVPGFTLIGTPAMVPDWRILPQEKMQMDAGMGATAAILDMLLHTRRGVNHIFAGVPARWTNIAFEGIRTEGAFLVSATRENGVVREVRVHSETGGLFRLANPWKDAEHPVLEFEMDAGQEIVIEHGHLIRYDREAYNAYTFIRVIAICVFRHNDQILVAEGFDTVANLPFYRPLGGTVEFGERTKDTVVREIEEELGQAITNVRLITVLENLFIGEGQPAHEIVFVYDGQFVDRSIYDQPSCWRRSKWRAD